MDPKWSFGHAGAIFFVVAFVLVQHQAETRNVPTDSNPLIYAQVMWRHGDRAPNSFFKNDPFTNSFPQGAGQLTAHGWEQQYALGQFLRARYSEYLNLDTTGLSYADVYVRSTDVDRAITSAQANIAAFFRPLKSSQKDDKDSKHFPPNDTKKWDTPDSDLHKEWQPVPIHTVPEKLDYVMHQNECDQLDVQKKKWEKSKQVQDLKNTPAVQAILRGCTHITGEPLESWTISKTFKSLADTLLAERNHGMMLPKVPPSFYDAVQDLRDRTWVMPYADKQSAQLRGGCLLDTIAQNMRNKLNSQTTSTTTATDKKKSKEAYSGRKVVLFSGHDTSLLGLISAAGLLDKVGAKPPYAASIYFELYKDGTVEISYKNDTTSLKAIRNGQPVTLLKAPLSDLETKWKDARVTETEMVKKCQASPADLKSRALADDNDDTDED